MKWFTSDLHFFHKNIVEYTHRSNATFNGGPVTPENHNEWLIDLWNSQVKPGNVCYHLGDLSFTKDVDKTLKILDRLNGQIVLIKGNHDHSDMFKAYAKHPKVVEAAQYKEIKIGDQYVCLFHFGMEVWHRQHHGAYHLCGHSHGSLPDNGSRRLDVGIDSAYNIFREHRFFTEKDVVQYMEKRPVVTGDHHQKRTGDL